LFRLEFFLRPFFTVQDHILSTAGDALKAVFVWELTFLIYIFY
jgi:hypothetical protein